MLDAATAYTPEPEVAGVAWINLELIDQHTATPTTTAPMNEIARINLELVDQHTTDETSRVTFPSGRIR